MGIEYTSKKEILCLMYAAWGAYLFEYSCGPPIIHLCYGMKVTFAPWPPWLAISRNSQAITLQSSAYLISMTKSSRKWPHTSQRKDLMAWKVGSRKMHDLNLFSPSLCAEQTLFTESLRWQNRPWIPWHLSRRNTWPLWRTHSRHFQ